MGARVCWLFVGLGLVGCGSPRVVPEEGLTVEARAYFRNFKLSDIRMQAAESFAGQVVTEIGGKITNSGDRTVVLAEVVCVFSDVAGQPVLREKVAIVKGALRPGETRTFRLPFDNIPESWSHQLPSLVIARIRFGS